MWTVLFIGFCDAPKNAVYVLTHDQCVINSSLFLPGLYQRCSWEYSHSVFWEQVSTTFSTWMPCEVKIVLALHCLQYKYILVMCIYIYILWFLKVIFFIRMYKIKYIYIKKRLPYFIALQLAARTSDFFPRCPVSTSNRLSERDKWEWWSGGMCCQRSFDMENLL